MGGGLQVQDANVPGILKLHQQAGSFDSTENDHSLEHRDHAPFITIDDDHSIGPVSAAQNNFINIL